MRRSRMEGNFRRWFLRSLRSLNFPHSSFGDLIRFFANRIFPSSRARRLESNQGHSPPLEGRSLSLLEISRKKKSFRKKNDTNKLLLEPCSVGKAFWSDFVHEWNVVFFFSFFLKGNKRQFIRFRYFVTVIAVHHVARLYISRDNRTFRGDKILFFNTIFNIRYFNSTRIE